MTILGGLCQKETYWQQLCFRTWQGSQARICLPVSKCLIKGTLNNKTQTKMDGNQKSDKLFFLISAIKKAMATVTDCHVSLGG